MFKFRKSLIAAGALLAGLTAVPAGAQTSSLPGGPFNTAFRVQNLGSAAATCSYELYSDNGTRAFSQAIPGTIAPGDSALVYTPNLTGLQSGTYAGVISCDQEVAAVVNFSSSDPAKAGGQADSYVGTTNPANTMYVPGVYNNYYNYYSTVRIQNTSTSAQNVTVEYFAPGAAAPADTQTVSIPANGAASVSQAGRGKLAANTSYSARIRGSSPLAVTVSIYGGAGTSVANQMYAFSGFAGGATTYYNPVIMRNFYGYNTATTIQNIGTQAADVQLTYSNGTSRTSTIQPGSSWLVLDFNEASLQRNVLYSSRVVSRNGQPLIVTVNESTSGTNRASTYEGIAASAASRTQVAPITLKRYYTYNSSVTCQNVGTAATNVSIAYRGAVGNTPVSVNGQGYTIQPGATQLFYQPGEANLPNGFIGSATLTSSAADIVCVANQDKNEAPGLTQSLDFLSAYNTIKK